MIYLKLVANAVWSALCGAYLIALLVFLLNPELARLGILSHPFARMLLLLLPAHVPALCLIFPTLMVFARFFAVRRLTVGWATLKVAVWLGVAMAMLMTFLYALSLIRAQELLSPRQDLALKSAVALLALGASCGAALASVGQWKTAPAARSLRIAACLTLLTPVCLIPLLLPLAAEPDGPTAAAPAIRSRRAGEPPGASRPKRRLLLIGIPSASLDHLLPIASTGKLPSFSRLLKEGAAVRLDGMRPGSSLVSWAALATGRSPWANGLRSERLCAEPAGRPWLQLVPAGVGLGGDMGAAWLSCSPRLDAAGLTARSFLEILPASGFPVRASGWELPSPSRPVRHVGRTPVTAGVMEQILGAPPRPRPGRAARLSEKLRMAVEADLQVDADPGPARIEGAEVLFYPGLGQVSPYLLRYHQPGDFGATDPSEQLEFGRALSGYYEFLDGLLQRRIESAGAGALVAVVSAHGIEPIALAERLAALLARPKEDGANLPVSGSWRGGPDGLFLLHGEGITPGARVEEAALVDVLPTLLYAMGAPVGRDLEGHLLRRIFERGWLDAHPVLYVPPPFRPAGGAPGGEPGRR